MTLSATQTHFTKDLDQDLSLRNLIIEVTSTDRGNGLKKFITYYSATLKVLIFENMGELKVSKGDEPLPLAYIKVYSRAQGGQVTFFKDGYTDLRGRFDYGQLSGKDISAVEKFSIFIQHDEYGSIVKEANTPNGVAHK